MSSLFLFAYLGVLLVVGAISSFIIYHIFRYSLDRSFGLIGACTFLLVLGFLLVINIIAFFSIDFSEPAITLPESSSSSQRTQAPYIPSRSNPW